MAVLPMPAYHVGKHHGRPDETMGQRPRRVDEAGKRSGPIGTKAVRTIRDKAMDLEYRMLELDRRPGFRWGATEHWVGRGGPQQQGDGSWEWSMAASDKGEERDEKTLLMRLLGICNKHNSAGAKGTMAPRVVEDQTQAWFQNPRVPGTEYYPRLCVDDPKSRGEDRGKLHVLWDSQQREGTAMEGETLEEEVQAYLAVRHQRGESWKEQESGD